MKGLTTAHGTALPLSEQVDAFVPANTDEWSSFRTTSQNSMSIYLWLPRGEETIRGYTFWIALTNPADSGTLWRVKSRPK